MKFWATGEVEVGEGEGKAEEMTERRGGDQTKRKDDDERALSRQLAFYALPGYTRAHATRG